MEGAAVTSYPSAASQLVASTMLGASLQRLVDTPERYGFTSDLTIGVIARDAEYSAKHN